MILQRLNKILFSRRSQERRGLGSLPIRAGRALFFASRDFHRDFCFERSATLAFATVISLIPLAVLFFSFAVQLGAGDMVMQYAREKLIPLAAPDFQQTLTDWLQENISKDAFQQGLVGIVGIAALISLILAALGVVVTAERSFNRVWKVKGQRTYLQKLNTFWVVLTTSPFIITASAGVGRFLMPPGGVLDRLLSGNVILQSVYTFLVPVSVGLVGFTVLYYFLPSARVRVRSAIVGGLVAAALWVLSKNLFYLYVGRTSSLYGSLAIVPLFLVWIYVNWTITLWGCEIAYVHQNLGYLLQEHLRGTAARQLPPAFIGLFFLERLGRAYRSGGGGWTPEEAADELDTVVQAVREVTGVLKSRGLLVQDSAEPGALYLTRDPSLVDLGDVVDRLPGESLTGGGRQAPRLPAAAAAASPGTVAVFRKAEADFDAEFRGKTLADLLSVQELTVCPDDL